MRITEKMLDNAIDHLNEITNSPSSSYTLMGDGKYKANIGNYHWSGAYGGYSLHRIMSEGGGAEDVFECGHIPKRDLYNRIQAMITGIKPATIGE